MSELSGKMHDSGERQSFQTGAVRDTATGKTRPDLISPFALERLGEWLRLGAEKYNERNWEAGMPISRCIASLWRHLLSYQAGRQDEDHLAAILCNAMFIAHYEHQISQGRMDPAIDDMQHYVDNPKPTLRKMTVAEAIAYDQANKILICNKSAVSSKPTFYIAGPMRGYMDFNFPAFDKARDRGRTLGFGIISPADLDRAAGIDTAKMTVAECEAKIAEIISRDVKAIMSLDPAKGDGIALLDGWYDSKGATAETLLARWLGLKIVLASNFKTEVDPIVLEDFV